MDKRGPETDEFQEELEGLAEIFGLPIKFLQAMQYLYEFNTALVDIGFYNFSHHLGYKSRATYEKELKHFQKIPWRGSV